MVTKRTSIYTTRLLSSARGGIWVADDHLLVSTSSVSMFETYRRFYFTDIQAIVMQPSSTSLAWRWVLLLASLPVVLIGFGMLYASAPTLAQPGRFVILMAFLLVWIFLTIFMTRHKSCRCELRTFTQSFDLSSVVRDERHFRRLLEIIEPKIRDCQGVPTEEDLAARAESWNQDAQDAAKVRRERHHEAQQQQAEKRRAATTQAKSSATGTSKRKRIVPVWHWLGIAGMALLVLVNLSGLAFPGSPVVMALLTLIELGTVGVMVGAVLHQMSSDMPRRLQAIPWLTLGVQLLAGSVAVLLFFVSLGQMQAGEPDYTMVITRRLFESIALAVLGVLGAVELARYSASPVEGAGEPATAERATTVPPAAPGLPPLPGAAAPADEAATEPAPEQAAKPFEATSQVEPPTAPPDAPAEPEPPADPDPPRE